MAYDQAKEQIAKLGEGLAAIGVPPQLFADNNCHEIFLTSRQYLRYLGIFRGKDRKQLELLLELGPRNDYWTTLSAVTMRNWFKFLTFVRTKEGQRQFQELIHVEKLKRRGAGDFTPVEVALVRRFEDLRNDFRKKEKELVRSDDHNDDDDELKLKRVRVREEFVPVSEYEGPDTEWLKKRCLERYRQLHPELIQLPQYTTKYHGHDHETVLVLCAMEKCSGFVIKQHVCEFLQQGRNKELLIQLIRKKLLVLEEEYHDRLGAGRISRDLAAIGDDA